MNVLYIITKSTSGGAQTHISQCVAHMKSKGHTVAVMANAGGWLENAIHDQDVEFFPNQYLSNSFDPINGYKAMKGIQRVAADFKPDLISLHSSAAGFWGRLAIRGSIPTIFTAHGWGFTDGVPATRKVIAIIAEKMVSIFCKKIICVSENDKQIALRYRICPAKKLVAVHNGVEDLQDIYPKKDYEDISADVSIFFVGRLDAQKDPELLVSAFQALPDVVRMRAQLFIIGDGEKRKILEEMMIQNNSKNITLLGDLHRSDVIRRLQGGTVNHHRIFVLTSHYEGFPRSILEAMSLGLAIIASDVGGVREAIDGTTGIIVPSGSVDAVAGALQQLIEHNEQIVSYGHHARAKMLAEFTLSGMLSKTESVYREVAARP